MDHEHTWRWQFLAFESLAEGCPVQDWFNPLPDDDKWEITDLLDTLQKVNDRLWPDEVFDPLNGAGGISEIKIPNIKCFRDGKFKMVTYRIYGYFGPDKRCYTFLHGAEKEVKNDQIGKRTAKRRLDELRRSRSLGTGFASVRKFNVEEKPDSTLDQGSGRPN